MPFANEKISVEDYERYDLKRLDKRLNGLKNAGRQWTIDREANIWLRLLYAQHDYTSDKPGSTGKKIWDFFWKGNFLSLETLNLSTISETQNDGVYFVRMRIFDFIIPMEIIEKEREIIYSLRQALITYAGGGVFSSARGCQIEFEDTLNNSS